MALVWPDLTALKHWLKVGIFPSRWITLTLLHWMWIGILTFEFWPNFGSVMAEFGVTFRVLVQFWSNFGPNLVTFGSNFCHILHFFYFCYIFIDLSNFGPIFYYEFRPNLGPFWPIFGQILAQFFDYIFVKFSPLSNIGPICPNFGYKFFSNFVPIFGYIFVEFWPNILVTFLSNFSRILVTFWSNFWLHFGQILTKFCQKTGHHFIQNSKSGFKPKSIAAFN